MATSEFNRQYPRVAIVDLGIENIGSGNGKTVKLPLGAWVQRINALTVTAFDSGTTTTVSVGDGTTTFVNAENAKTTGYETVANTPKFYPNGGTITASLAETGDAATEGRQLVSIEYFVVGAGDDIYG